MDDLDLRKKAIERLLGDMDGIEGEGMFPKEPEGLESSKGVDVTISVEPKTGEPEAFAGEESPEEEAVEDDLMGMHPSIRKAMLKGK